MTAPTTSPVAADDEAGGGVGAGAGAGAVGGTGIEAAGQVGAVGVDGAAAATVSGPGIASGAPEPSGTSSSPSPSAATAGAPPRGGRGLRVVRKAAASASLLSGLLLGFGAYTFGLSSLQEQHSQADLYRVLDAELLQATAPTGPAADGAPVAILDIPAIGLHQTVVVEGTTAADLARGPGLLRDTVLPGQHGVSVLMGRRGTFGAPFARVPQLVAGDKITVTTGQGQFTYTVNALGQGSHPITDGFKDRLVLATADSTWFANHVIFVGARLDGANPAPVAGKHYARSDLDKPLASDTDAWSALQLWALALAFAVTATVALVAVWNRRAVYLAMTPVLAALLWCVYENAAVLLPNLY